MPKWIISVVAAVALVPPALADEYWVKYDYSTHECSIIKSTTHLTETRFPWSPPNDGSKPKRSLDAQPNAGAATAGGGESGNSSADGTNDAVRSNGSNSPAEASGDADKANDSGANSNAVNEARPPHQNNDTSNDFAHQLAASWKRKAELAEKNHIDVSTALIGSPMQSREQAEQEMQIMRKCGLKN